MGYNVDLMKRTTKNIVQSPVTPSRYAVEIEAVGNKLRIVKAVNSNGRRIDARDFSKRVRGTRVFAK